MSRIAILALAAACWGCRQLPAPAGERLVPLRRTAVQDEPSPCATPSEASFWVLSPSGDGTASRGSGTGIGPHLVVTNAHVVDHRLAPVTVGHTLSGEAWQGRTIAVSSGPDLALIWIDGDVPHVRLAERDPRHGDAVRLFGYGSRKILRTNEGRIVDGKTGQRGYVVLNSTVLLESGDSGGGLFDQAGRLAAVNWGTYGNESASTPISAVWELLASASQRKGEDLAACQDCGSGGGYGFARPGGGGGPMRPVQPDGGDTAGGGGSFQPWRKSIDELGGRVAALEQGQQTIAGRIDALAKAQPADLPGRTARLEADVSGQATLIGNLTTVVERREAFARDEAARTDQKIEGAKGELLEKAKLAAADAALSAVDARWPWFASWAVGLAGGSMPLSLGIGLAVWIAHRRLRKLQAKIRAKRGGPAVPRILPFPRGPSARHEAEPTPSSGSPAAADAGGRRGEADAERDALARDLAACREARGRQQAELDRLAVELRRERAEIERVRNQYVHVPDRSTDAAWARSHKLVAEQYPAAASYFKIAERVKDQIVSGEQPAPPEPQGA